MTDQPARASVVIHKNKRGAWCVCVRGNFISDLGRVLMSRFGKHTAGRLLDGQTWDELPKVGVR
mgnify:CR=1 FL=1